MRQAGDRFGAFEIVSLLGRGGMGEVYRARDVRLMRDVALKVLPAERTHDPVALARFQGEARAASALNDPHIVVVHDVGEADGVPFIVMELVEGRTLRELMYEGRLPLRRALEIAVQVAEGLAAAHAKGIVHRDLKPENILVSKEGLAKIADFGLAKLKQPLLAAADDTTVGGAPTATGLPPVSLTGPATVMGTVGYMSPEQAAGRPLDHRSDQFAFGSMLYELISGRRAFERPTPAETLAAILREEPTPLAVDGQPVEGPLCWVVERCLAKDPHQRYDSTRDLARDLERPRHSAATSSSANMYGASAAFPTPSAAFPTPSAPRARAWPRVVSLLLALGAALGVGLLLARWWRAEPVFDKLSFRRGTVWNGRFAPDGETLIYSASWEGRPFALFRKEPGNAESLPVPLEANGPATVFSISSAGEMAVGVHLRVVLPGRLMGMLARVPTAGGAPREILDEVRDADWAPNGRDLAVVRAVAGKTVLEYPLGQRLYETASWLSEPRVSPDGRQVAFFDHPLSFHDMGVVMLVEPPGPPRVVGGLWTSSNGLAWSPAGDEIWVAAAPADGPGPNALYAISLTGATRLLARAPGPLTLLDCSPRGQALIARESRRVGLVVYSPAAGRERDVSILEQSVLADLSEDGTSVLSTEYGEGGGRSHSVYLRSGHGAAPVRLGDGMALALAPDRRFVLALLPAPPPRLVAYPTGAGELQVIADPGLERYHGASFFPDGRRIVIAANEAGRAARLYVRGFPVGRARPISAEGISVGYLQGYPVSPDGRWVAALGPDLRIMLVPTSEGAPRALTDLPPGLAPIRWLANGQALLVARLDELPLRVRRLDLASGKLQPVCEIALSDPAGVQGFPSIRFAADGRTYAYSYGRVLSELYRIPRLR